MTIDLSGATPLELHTNLEQLWRLIRACKPPVPAAVLITQAFHIWARETMAIYSAEIAHRLAMPRVQRDQHAMRTLYRAELLIKNILQSLRVISPPVISPPAGAPT